MIESIMVYGPSNQQAIDRFLKSEVSDARSFNPKLDEAPSTIYRTEIRVYAAEIRTDGLIIGLIAGIALTIFCISDF